MWRVLSKQAVQLTFLVLLPLIYGVVASRLPWLVTVLPAFLVQVVFAVLWFWAGLRFAAYFQCSVRGCLRGNVLWALSFLLFVWQFFLTDDSNRNYFLAEVAQWYMHGFLWSGLQIATAFLGDPLIGSHLIMSSYLIMLLTFLSGSFAYAALHRTQERP